MTDPRLSTVYDYSNLRLHPDGTRVYQKTTNFRPDLAKITVQGPRSSWIARDAGGSGKILKTRKRIKDPLKESEPGENLDGSAEEEQFSEIDEKTSEEDEDEDDEPDKTGRKRKPKRFNPLVPKRLKFAADYDYLQDQSSSPHAGQSTDAATTEVTVEQGLPEPSADLLKYIHRYAAEFYTERGQLLNISRKYRKERRAQARQKLLQRERQVRLHKARVNPGSSSESSESHSEEEESSEKDSDEIYEEEDEEEDDEDDEDEEKEENVGTGKGDDEDENPQNGNKGKGKAKRPRKYNLKVPEQLYTDMYKMFDGSAIMALGMLVQEQIAQMLNPEMPEGWKEEMEKTFGSFSAEDLQGEDAGEDEDGDIDEENAEEEGEENEGKDEDECECEESENEDEGEGEEENNHESIPQRVDMAMERGAISPNDVSQRSSKRPLQSVASPADDNDEPVQSDTEDSEQ